VKLWVSKLQKEEVASNSKACFIASFRSWEHVHTYTHTHTHKVWLQYKIWTRWCNPTYTYFPCTWVLKLAFRLCILVCIWACNHVGSNPCSTFGRKKKKKKKNTKLKNFFFFFTCHRRKPCGRGSLYNVVLFYFVQHPLSFCLMSIVIPSVQFHPFDPFHPPTFIRHHSICPVSSVRPLWSMDVCLSPLIPINTSYSSIVCIVYICIRYPILQTICCVKILELMLCIVQNFGAWDNIMSLVDESTTA
jgi:hypothetical protein